MYMRYSLAVELKSWYTPWLLAWVTLQDASSLSVRPLRVKPHVVDSSSLVYLGVVKLHRAQGDHLRSRE